jgi:hypothetical protein
MTVPMTTPAWSLPLGLFSVGIAHLTKGMPRDQDRLTRLWVFIADRMVSPHRCFVPQRDGAVDPVGPYPPPAPDLSSRPVLGRHDTGGQFM